MNDLPMMAGLETTGTGLADCKVEPFAGEFEVWATGWAGDAAGTGLSINTETIGAVPETRAPVAAILDDIWTARFPS